MTERHVGLDIGSFGVRAAEVSVEAGGAVLHRYAQLTLPPRAVVEGEIRDTGAVAATIRDLWAKGGFKADRVVVGVSTGDIKVREAEAPDLAPAEVRGALRYEAHDLMPSSDADAVVDYVVQDRFNRDGVEMLKVLVVAAPRQQIDNTISAVTAAGLQVEGIDLMPFALVRSLASRTEPSTAEVIVSVGAGLTSVVVCADGIPQLVRTTPGGGGAITDALANRLSVSYEEAEAVKRTASAHTVEGQTATTLIEEQLGTLVREIVGSVDFFVAQSAGVEVRRIILTGSGSLAPGLRERIRAESQLEVVPADALRNVALAKTRLTPEQLVAASTTLAGPIGLAMAPVHDPSTRLTGLVPESYLRRLGARREAKFSVAAVACLGAVLLGTWAQRTVHVHSADAAVTRENGLRRVIDAKDIAYSAYAKQEATLTRRTSAVKGALAGDTDVAAIMDRVSASLPPDVWLESATISVAHGKSAGAVAFQLGGVDDSSPAHWLAQMRTLTSVFSNVWVSGIVEDGKSVRFASSATLSPAVTSPRAAAFVMPK